MVVVDYAHTDDALRNVIAAARGMNAKRVITLFGCGGDRDRSKRPLMGMAAAELSDEPLGKPAADAKPYTGTVGRTGAGLPTLTTGDQTVYHLKPSKAASKAAG